MPPSYDYHTINSGLIETRQHQISTADIPQLIKVQCKSSNANCIWFAPAMSWKRTPVSFSFPLLSRVMNSLALQDSSWQQNAHANVAGTVSSMAVVVALLPLLRCCTYSFSHYPQGNLMPARHHWVVATAPFLFRDIGGTSTSQSSGFGVLTVRV